MNKKNYPVLDERKIAFAVMPEIFTAYTGTRINAATQVFPIQAYQWLSAYLKLNLKGFKTCVIDMGIIELELAWHTYKRFLLEERPKYLGLMVVTPSFFSTKLAGIIAKEVLGPELVLIHGGVHASNLASEALSETLCDVVVKGEGEATLADICSGMPIKDVRGVFYRTGEDDRSIKTTTDEIIRRLSTGELAYYVALDAMYPPEQSVKLEVLETPPRKFLTMDDLPPLDLDLYPYYLYKMPRLLAHEHPWIGFETSRGCPFHCNFCSAEDAYRVFSPDKVIELMKYFKFRNIKELRITDDQYLTNVKRGKIIHQKMLEHGLHFAINLGNGVRADRIDREFLDLATRTGLYSLGAGFESGDQDALDSIQKSLSLDKSIECMKLLKEFNVETIGFFMIGAPKDTPRSMQKTIDFAKKLRPDFAKATIFTPFPDTRAFKDWKRAGLILSERWDLYNIHRAEGMFRHPNPELTPEVLRAWYNKFYREFYSPLHNPGYAFWKIKKSIGDGSFLRNVGYAAKTFFPRLFPASPLDNIRAGMKEAAKHQKDQIDSKEKPKDVV
ncbi:MAG: radical SAM protein [Candidatus Yanofskybacteria bacterium]|nr:radical SAM protein [Candidatus Yanofskybacteria bacterium]